MTLKTAVAAALPALLLSLTAQAAPAAKPEDVVIAAVDSVLDRVRSEKELLAAQPEKVYEVIDDLITPHFDFQIMSRWVLGKHWRTASAEQRELFVKEFQTLLIRTYAKGLLEFNEEKVNYLETLAGRRPEVVMVKTEVAPGGGRPPTPINYTMRLNDGRWKVVNVAFAGVSLVETYRKSFASEISNHGFDALLQKLAGKNQGLARALTE